MKPEIPTIETRVAFARDEEHSYCGHRIFEDLLGKETTSGLLWLAVGGERLSNEKCSVIDDLAVVLAVADPRIWPLKIARIAASYGGSVAGVAAGSVLLEGAQLGPWTIGEAAELLTEYAQALGGQADEATMLHTGRSLAQRKQRLSGFGVAFREHDERLIALRGALRRRDGRDRAPWFTKMEWLARAVELERQLKPNVAAGVGAALLDLGLTPHQVSQLGFAIMQPTIIANAVEGSLQSRAAMRCMPCDSVVYKGPKPQLTPRAAQQRS